MRRFALLALGLGLLVALAACGETEPAAAPTPEPATPSPEPAETPEATPTPTPTPEPTPTDEPPPDDGVDEVTVYFARDHDSGVWVEPEVVALDEPTVAVARAAYEALVAGEPREPGRMSLAGEGAQVLDVNIAGGILTVDFNDALVPDEGLGAAYEEALVQQIAHTGAQFEGVDAVQIRIEGAQVESLAGHVGVEDPVAPDELALSPITFTSHFSTDSVDVGDVAVGGEASTFEATIELQLVAPDGSVAEDTFTTATAGGPERGTWEHTFTLPEPGVWTIRALEPDPSAGEGRPPFEVTLELEAG